ncbi:hypothetical protein BOSEA31B_10537 [Hyphomicrobiales bacterium]|nr:hypothetical protein BOSEA31B_10537 [Hyphomicrobiales bacterium]CAH1700391.1 hypothetical protein BOSEA1005_20090 [Hyphomicrobiales bacterium]
MRCRPLYKFVLASPQQRLACDCNFQRPTPHPALSLRERVPRAIRTFPERGRGNPLTPPDA